MKLIVAFTVVFVGLTLWTLINAPLWVAPAPALFTAGYICLIPTLRRERRGEPFDRLVRTRLTLWYFALAWLVGCIGGPPNRVAFWVLFGAVAAIASPLLTVMWRSQSKQSTG